MVLCQKKKKKLGSKTTAAAVPPLSITVTLALAAWGPKFLFDLKCQHRCPDNFHSVTLPVCPQMQRALIGAGKRWGCLSISLVGEMKQPHSDPLSQQKRIPASNKYRFSVLILARTKFILPILKQHIWIRRRDCFFPKGFAKVLVIHLPRCSRAAVQAWRILSDVFSFNVIQSRRKQSHIFEMRNGEEKKKKICRYTRLPFEMQLWSCPAFSAQTRNNFVSTKQEVEKLMKRIRSADQDYKPPGQWTMEGFLYVQEKRESF